MKKTGVVVAGVAALLLTAAPFAFADSQGQNDRHNGQNCGQTIPLEIPAILGEVVSEHRNDSTCAQDEDDERHDKDHD